MWAWHHYILLRYLMRWYKSFEFIWKAVYLLVSLSNVHIGRRYRTGKTSESLSHSFILDPYAKVWGDGWMILQWADVRSCVLHVNTRPSIWKPRLNLCNWHLTCHVINTRCSQSQAATHHLFSPLPVFLHRTSWSNHGVQGKGGLDWVCFLVLELQNLQKYPVKTTGRWQGINKEGKVQERKKKNWRICVVQQFMWPSRPVIPNVFFFLVILYLIDS